MIPDEAVEAAARAICAERYREIAGELPQSAQYRSFFENDTRMARAALTAAAPHMHLPAQPEGWRLVPVKLTPAMACALEDCVPPPWKDGDPHGAIDQLIRDYQPEWDRALAAAPILADQHSGA